MKEDFSEFNSTDLNQIYEYLESYNNSKIDLALKALKENVEFRKKAEKRYLYFIKSRLNDTKVTIFDYKKAAPSIDEISFLMDKDRWGGEIISFANCNEKESKLMIDFIGGIVRCNVKLLQLISKIKRTTEAYYIPEIIEDFRNNFEKDIGGDRIFLCANGWYSKIAVRLYNLRKIKEIIFKNTAFQEANSSQSLEAFMFLLIIKQFGDTTIRVQGSSSLNFTKLFWMFLEVPNTVWHDQKTMFPNSILSYQRVASYSFTDDKDDFNYVEK